MEEGLRKSHKIYQRTCMIKFTFLGYKFQPTQSVNKKTGRQFANYLPAVSSKAKSKFRERIKNTRLLKTTQITIEEIALKLNPIVRGWCNYFSYYYQSALSRPLEWLNVRIKSWYQQKYRLSTTTAYRYVRLLQSKNPNLFWHWTIKPFPERAV